MKSAPLQAIVFDFDGVLVESTDIKTRAFAELYAPHGEDVAARVVQFHLANGGLSRYVKFRYAQEVLLGGEPLSDTQMEALDSRFSQLVMDKVVAAPVVAGAPEVLQQYQGQIPMFVASGTPQLELEQIIERRGMQAFFADIFGSPTSKAEAIGRILDRYALDASATLMVGDALADLDGAEANDTRFLGRVPAAADNPFPETVVTVPDLTSFAETLKRL